MLATLMATTVAMLCKEQGITPAPEVTAMAHEMLENAREALVLAARVRSEEQQLGIPSEDYQTPGSLNA